MPSVEVLEAAFGKRNAPIKAVLLDQNGVSHLLLYSIFFTLNNLTLIESKYSLYVA